MALRVGVVVPGWSAEGEPPALPALRDLLVGLAARHDVEIVALRHPPRAGAYRDRDGLAVASLGIGARAGPGGRLAVLARGVAALGRLHRERRFDLLHAFWADEPGLVAASTASIIGVPVAASVMGGELVADESIGYGAALGLGGRLATAATLRRAGLVTVGSRALFRAVAPVAPGTPLLLAPLGVDPAAFPARDRAPAGPPGFLFVGSLTPVKEPVLLLRAFARLHPPDSRLVVAGDGPLRPGLERLAELLGVRSRVTFTGSVPRVRLPELLATATALVVTSRHESQSMVAVEAAMSGVPVVGTAVGVVPELAQAGGGIGVPVGDLPGLVAALERVGGDPATAAAMAAAAAAWASKRWRLDAAVDRFDAAWSGLLACDDGPITWRTR
jgi:glycosyltransferase involved in cell wall biosynthesis